jgi:hypothetical protein
LVLTICRLNIANGVGEALTHAEFLFRLSQQDEPGIGGLVSAVKVNGQFLAFDG